MSLLLVVGRFQPFNSLLSSLFSILYPLSSIIYHLSSIIYHLLTLPPPLRRHGIVAVSAERVASQHPPGGQQRPLECAVDGQSLDRVIRAAWLKSATSAKQRRQCRLVRTHEKNQDRPHRFASPRNSAITSAVHRPRKAARPTSTQSASGGNSEATSRKPSRRIRLARFRSTASWKLLLETTTPA